ncbi:glutathione peroxidase-like peroxiredoxin Hyr1p [[Candida] railenensis]|uniref:Glutathione peroxidase n=1 Tax=[Candida] railenensis TaxID=45579 RepID=A0A9P0QN22_9ASCO|nr:glutathione peroxidase-like peroxiredoxin Hyr1p [[Candida] railenensis]
MGDYNYEFYNLSCIDPLGNTFNFEALKGKVVIIVNSASYCGFSSQYEEFEELYKKYSGKLEIISFPSNQFGSQEPFTGKQLLDYHRNFHKISFPIMERIDCNGKYQSPVYAYLTQAKPGVLGFKGVKWNYEKFLITKKGEVFGRYSSITTPVALDAIIKKLVQEESGDEVREG